LEGRPCATNHECLDGYICDWDANICILNTLSEEDTIETADADSRDLDGSTIDPSVDATARESFRAIDNNEENTNRIDATARESFRAIDNNEQDANRFDATRAPSDADAIASSIDSHFEIDSGGTAGQGGVRDANEAGSSGGSPDSGGLPDAGSNVLVCGQSIAPTGTGRPDICRITENGVCYIVCDDEQLCDEDITCPPDFNCEVQCTHQQACAKLTIECPEKNACIVSCTGESSCEKANINCDKGPCELRCHTGAHACDKAKLWCGIQECKASCGPGQDEPEIKKCDLSCSTDCGC